MEHEGILDALRDDPDEDGLRLIYADWLEDHGDAERAEFIRLQVQLPRLAADDPDRPALAAREQELRQAHGERFLGVRTGMLRDFAFRGGLVDRVTLMPDVPLADVEPLFRCHPVRVLTVNDEELLRDLAVSPILGLVGGLRVAAAPHPSRRLSLALDRLLGSAHLHLRSLEMAGSAVDNHLCHVLSCNPGLKGLRHLRLVETRVDDGGVVRLLQPGALPCLETWHVDCPTATGLGLANLFGPAHAPRWRSLNWPQLRSCGPGDLEGLRRCSALEGLELTLPFRRREGDRLFGWLDGLRCLRELRLSGPVDPAALAELVSRSALAWLRVLQVRLSYPADGSAREHAQATLTASPHLGPATQLTVGA